MTPDPSKSSDPGNPKSWNQYAYSYGDPVNNLDPSGLDPCGSSTSSSNGVISVTVYDCSNPPDGWDMYPDGYGWGAYNNQYDSGKYAAHVYPLIAPGTTQNQDQALDAGIDSAWAHIISNPNCVMLLTGNSGVGYTTALERLAYTLDNTTYSFAPLPSGTAAQTNQEGGNQVTISTTGIFFTLPTFGAG